MRKYSPYQRKPQAQTSTPIPGFGDVPVEVAVERLSGIGIPPAQISLVLGVPERILHTKFAAELRIGKAKASVQVANAIFQTAIDRQHPKHATMAIFWARAQMGWIGGVAEDEANDMAAAGAGLRNAAPVRPRLGDQEVNVRFAALMETFVNAEPGESATAAAPDTLSESRRKTAA